jgi:hypothetical protein
MTKNSYDIADQMIGQLEKDLGLTQSHTPTPWVYYPDHYMIRTDATFQNERKDIAATSCGNGAEHANAEFIVRACNSFYELVALVELLHPLPKHDHPSICKRVDAALAKANSTWKSGDAYDGKTAGFDSPSKAKAKAGAWWLNMTKNFLVSKSGSIKETLGWPGIQIIANFSAHFVSIALGWSAKTEAILLRRFIPSTGYGLIRIYSTWLIALREYKNDLHRHHETRSRAQYHGYGIRRFRIPIQPDANMELHPWENQFIFRKRSCVMTDELIPETFGVRVSMVQSKAIWMNHLVKEALSSLHTSEQWAADAKRKLQLVEKELGEILWTKF